MNDSDTSFTGERFVPGRSGSRIEKDHLSRYLFSTKYAAGVSVLDIACGSGYGAPYFLRAGALDYTGVDISPQSVDYARANYRAEKVTFLQGDVCNFSAQKKYGLITCFETIEHVLCYRKAVAHLRDALVVGGTLIISSPNRPVTTVGAQSVADKPNNPFHTQEFTASELCGLLVESGFSVADGDVYGQRLRPAAIQRVFSVLRIPDIFAFLSSSGVSKYDIQQVPRYFLIVARKSS